MPYLIIYEPTTGIIETVIQGKLFLPEAEAIITEIADLAAQERCLLGLIDLREVTFVMTAFQIYTLPRTLARIVTARGLDPTRLNRAFVVTLDDGDFHFYETVTTNLGQHVRLYIEIETARKWLLEK